MARKKVAILGAFPPPVDGQTMATKRLAELLSPIGDVHPVQLSKPSQKYRDGKVRFRTGALLHYLRVRTSISSELERLDPDIVLWSAISPSVLGHIRDMLVTYPAIPRRAATFGIVHWGNFDGLFKRRLTARTARRSLRRLKGLVFLTPSLSEACAPFVPQSMRFVIPNTIDDAMVCSDEEVQSKQESYGHGVFRILFVSNLTRSKGFLDVLDAVSELRQGGVAVQADFVGRWDGDEERSRTLSAAEQQGISQNVEFHGEIRDRETLKQMHLRAHAFVLPTYYPTEAQPLVIIEAMSAASPIVTTRHAGIPEMVGSADCASYVPPRNPEEIANSILALRADREAWLKKSHDSRRRFQAAFSPDVVRSHWQELLDRHADV